MRRIILGLIVSFLLLGGTPALTSRRAHSAQSQEDQAIPIDDSFWQGTVTIEESSKDRKTPNYGTGFHETESKRKTTFTLDRVPRYADVDQWVYEDVPFVVSGSYHSLEVIPPDPEVNFKGARTEMSDTVSGSGTAEVSLTPEGDDEEKPTRIRLRFSPNTDHQKVTIKRHWIKTTDEGTRIWDEELEGGGGRGSVVAPYDPDQGVLSGVKTDRRPYSNEMDGNLKGVAETRYNYSLTLSRPSDIEAVIIPFSGYEDWIPEGGKDEDTEGGFPIVVDVKLRLKSKPDKEISEKAKFKFELIDTSKEPGLCLNVPKKDKAKRSYDLKFKQENNSDLDISNEGQIAKSKDYQKSETAVVSSYDWGAYGKLRVTATLARGKKVVAHVEGKPQKTEMVIPFDENDNRVADEWEKQEGVFDKKLPANWDGAEEPKGQKAPGDGISLYEKYRGFEFEEIHERLDPNHKYLFVHDPDEVVRRVAQDSKVKAMSFESVSKLRLRYVDDDHWTGLGSSGQNKRIINFNSEWKAGHAEDQHALSVIVVGEYIPGASPIGWGEGFEPGGESPTSYSEEKESMRFPDMVGGFGSPRRTYQIMIFPSVIQRKWIDMILTFASPLMPVLAKIAKDGTFGQIEKIMKEINKWIAECKRTHPQENEEALTRWTALFLSRELAHGVGVESHDPPDSGNNACVIGEGFPYAVIPSSFEALREDMFLLKVPWPNEICADRCRSQVIVSDLADKKSGK